MKVITTQALFLLTILLGTGASSKSLASPTWSTEVHNLMIESAFPEEEWLCKVELEKGSQEADKATYQARGYAYMHAMREKGQELNVAVEKMWAYVDQKYAEIRLLDLDRRFQDACYLRGMALHPIMDATSPAHRNFAEWDPIEFKDLLNPSVLPGKIADLVKHGDVDGWIKRYVGITLPFDISDENMSVIQAHPELLNLTVSMMKLIDQLGRQP